MYLLTKAIVLMKNGFCNNSCSKRTFKNFGHKRQPVPQITVLWHGFLTFTFIGLAIEWKKMANIVFGNKNEEQFNEKAKNIE